MVATKDSKELISKAFQQILTDRKRIDSRIATKEEEAEKEKNQQILEVASTYTIDGIVKGLADLQLEFGNIVKGLSEKLAKEASKLDELNRAISVEIHHLQELQQVRVQNQEARIHNLSKQLDGALKQVQDLAVKAIEGASNINSYQALKEIAMEQAKAQTKNK